MRCFIFYSLSGNLCEYEILSVLVLLYVVFCYSENSNQYFRGTGVSFFVLMVRSHGSNYSQCLAVYIRRNSALRIDFTCRFVWKSLVPSEFSFGASLDIGHPQVRIWTSVTQLSKTWTKYVGK